MTRRWLASGCCWRWARARALGPATSSRRCSRRRTSASGSRCAGDVAGLGAAMSDDLTYTHSNASVETKAEFLEAIRSGKSRYKSMTFDDRRVRLHGDSTAIVSGTCRVQVTTGGRDLDLRLRFTELYVKQAGTWKMALWQSTRVPDPAP